MRFIRSISFALCLTAPLAAACGDDGATSGGGGGEGGGTTTTTGPGTTTSTGSGPACEAPEGTPSPANDVVIDGVTATADDEAGDPLADFDLQLCGKDVCLYGTTNALGQVTFDQGGDTLDSPLFKPNDSLVVGKIGYLYDGVTDPAGVFPTMIDSDSAMEPGASVTAAGVTLTIPADGVVAVDELTYDEPAKQTFRAASIPAAQVEAATGDAEFAMVYALGPIDTLFCPAAQVEFVNYADLAPDSAVGIYVQEVNIAEHFGAYGAWTRIAGGTVSSDGQTVSIDEGVGLPVLLNVAIKPE